MTIELSPEQEQVIGRAIQAGLIRTADDVVGVGVETIQRRLEERRAPANPTSAEQWLQGISRLGSQPPHNHPSAF